MGVNTAMREVLQRDLAVGILHREQDTTDMHNCYTDPVGAMKALWNSTIPKGQQDLYSWAVDPWIWVIEFERCERPEAAGKEKIDGKNKETQIFSEGA